MFPTSLRLILMLTGFGLGIARAQHYLAVEVDGTAKVVRKVSEHSVQVMEDGRLKSVPMGRSGLVPAPEFMPVFVAVRSVQASAGVILTGGGGRVNNNFDFGATFESPYWLEDVFFVLALRSARGGKFIYAQGVGSLEPGKPRAIAATVQLKEELNRGGYELHIFSQGQEVFTSAQPAAIREQALDLMVSKRIQGVKDALPTPLLGPVPEYPKGLAKSKVKGEAVVKVRISSTGAVTDPQVESATDPAFGEAAVVAVREWRFVPRLKDGQPVEATAAVPFAFEPPVPQKD